MFTSIEEITKKLAEIRQRRYIPSNERGLTGVGHTLLVELGMTESYFTVPDLGEVELRGICGDSDRLITLFELDGGAWQFLHRDFLSKYGKREGDQVNLRLRLSGTEKSQGLQLEVEAMDSNVLLRSNEGTVLARWHADDLLTQFHRHVRHLILVCARSREQNGIKQFYYDKATFYSGWTLRWHIPKLFEDGIVKVDLRMGLVNDRVQNHGTRFRIAESDIVSLYTYSVVLPIEWPLDSFDAFV